MNNGHDFEALDLYALGTLDEERAAEIDRHVRECDMCAKRLGEAERTVTALLEREYAPARRRLTYWIPATVAAALLLWVVPLGLLGSEVAKLHNAQLADATAVTALVHSHFLHVPFTAATDAPRAKVLYGRSDPWLYVVADGDEGLQVAVSAAGSANPRIVGTLRKVGQESTLFARAAHVREVMLLRDGKPVARAKLLGKND